MNPARTSLFGRGGKRIWRPIAAGIGLASLALVALPGVAGAQEVEPLPISGQQVNLLWVVLGAILVIFMQAGFALVETGFCRAKHAAHVVSTNFAIFALGFVGFFIVGFGFAFGGFSYAAFGMDTAVGDAFIGSGEWTFLYKGGFMLTDMVGPGGAGAAGLGFFLYMVAFMDTVATIPTGSMAERWKWSSFMVWGLFCGAIYYPLFAAWTWGGGWLGQLGNSMELGLGYVDFAGSGVVHAVGFAPAACLGQDEGLFAASWDDVATALQVSKGAMTNTLGHLERAGWIAVRPDEKDGRSKRVDLTEAGRVALGYAETIFATGAELTALLREGRRQERQVLRIGAVATLSRNFQENFLTPLLQRDDVELVLQSGSLGDLLGGAHQGARPQIVALQAKLESEIEWQPLQIGKVDEVSKAVANPNGSPSIVVAYQFFKYQGPFDDEGLVDPGSLTPQMDGQTAFVTLADGRHDLVYVGQQLAAFNANQPLAAAVPEPQSCALMAGGLGLLACLSRRRGDAGQR